MGLRIKLVLPAVLAVGAAVPFVSGPVQAGTAPTTVAEPVSATTVETIVETTVPSSSSVVSGVDGDGEAVSVPSTSVGEDSPSTSIDETISDDSVREESGEVDAVQDSVPPSSLAADAPATSVAAADQTGSLGGYTWVDVNGNGLVDDGEQRLIGYDIDITCEGAAYSVIAGNEEGYWHVDDVPLGQCTLDVLDAVIDDDFIYSADPDGVLDGVTTVTLTADAPSRLDLNFGFRLDAEMYVEKGVTTVDRGADGRFSVGDTISYEIAVSGNAADLADVRVSDPKLGLDDVLCAEVLGGFNYDVDTCTVTGTYVITAADIAAGGVENSATAKAVEEATGFVVSARSDTTTDPNGVAVLDGGRFPMYVETPNPLKEYPNDPNDPWDDPTTLLFTTIPTDPGGTSSPKPVTGSSSVLVGFAALMLVGAGVGLVVLSKKEKLKLVKGRG